MQVLSSVVNTRFELRSGSHTFAWEKLRVDCTQQRVKYKELRGKIVAVQGNPEHFIKSLLFLDGFARCLVLVPENSCSRLVSSVLDDIDIDAVIVDESVDLSTWPIPVSVELETQSSEILSVDGSHVQLHPVVDTQWMLPTSGTTGMSRYVNHSLESLCRTVARSTKNVSLRWGLLYDPARFAGLQVVLQALLSGASLVVSKSDAPLAKRVDYLVKQGVTALSGTPTLWRHLLMIEQFANLDISQITLGGEIVDGRLIKTLATQFPAGHITHIYASTEAGVGFAVHDGEEGFPAAWIDQTIGGIRLAISETNTLLIQSLANVQTYADRSIPIFDDQGWHDTGDLLEVVGNRVIFKGRLNGSINVGGNKVMPEEVERHIEKLDFVSRAIVSGRKNSIAGNLLEATIVLTSEERDLDAAVQSVSDHCSKSLVAYKVPVFIKVIESIPISASGKLKRG